MPAIYTMDNKNFDQNESVFNHSSWQENDPNMT